MNRRAQASDVSKEQIIWIVNAIIFFIAIALIVAILYIPINIEFKTDGLRHSLLRQHLLYDKNCLAYEQDRVYPGIVDINKFTQSNLEKCFDTKFYGTQLVLKTDSISTIKLNEELNKYEFCVAKNDFYCSNTTYYILVKDKEIKPATLYITLLNKK